MAELSRLWYNCHMGILNDPTPGQPIDVGYISQIVKSVNALSDDYVTKDKQSRVTKIRGKQTFDVTRTSNLAFVGGYIIATSDAKTTTRDVIEKVFQFNRTFNSPPIVVATPEIASSGVIKETNGVTVVITKVTNTAVTMKVIFDSKSAKTNIGINIIAIGIPSALG